MSRRDLSFASGAETCAAWHYPASGATGEGPIVVMAHGLSGTRRDRLGPFAERFSAAGFGALVFDHRGFGDSTGEPDLFKPALQLEDWRAAISFARSLPAVDPERVATFGSSMGGGNALAAAAEDRRVAAAISQVPFLDIVSQAHRASPRVTARMLLAAVRGEHLPAVGSPGEAAFINAPGAEAGWRHVVAIGEESRWRNRVSSRWLLGAPSDRSATPRACTARGWSASARPTASPGPGPRSAPRAARPSASCAPTPASITSTSTTAPDTRPSSPTSSTSCGGTCSAASDLSH